MALTLVILAAGLGSRFGGPKQLAPVGPGGERLLDYTIYDARRAGFDRAVVVIGSDLRTAWESALVSPDPDRLPLTFMEQRLDALPAGSPPRERTRPWGTAHAVLSVAACVSEPFAIANADDFYGRGPLQALAVFLSAPTPRGTPAYALVSFPLGETLPDRGAVNRARLVIDPHGWLEQIEELSDIERAEPGGRIRSAGGPTRMLAGNTPVSMNLWGFTPAVFPQLAEEFQRFLDTAGADSASELLLPTAVDSLISRGVARVRVLPAMGEWCGMTHAEDRARAAKFFRELVERGDYPRDLGSAARQ